jgi:hypothetical protein
VISSHYQKGKIEAKKKIMGITHEQADLMKQRAYMFEIMKECEISKGHISLKE